MGHSDIYLLCNTPLSITPDPASLHTLLFTFQFSDLICSTLSSSFLFKISIKYFIMIYNFIIAKVINSGTLQLALFLHTLVFLNFVDKSSYNLLLIWAFLITQKSKQWPLLWTILIICYFRDMQVNLREERQWPWRLFARDLYLWLLAWFI
jgi:hypothetical protein